MSDAVLVTAISTIGGIVATYLTVKYKNRVLKSEPPRDRIETVLDGYDRLVSQQEEDIKRKQSIIGGLEGIITKLEAELADTRSLLQLARAELAHAEQNNTSLQQQLREMRQRLTTDAGQQKAYNEHGG